MSSIELPSEVEEIYGRIKKQYRVEFEPFNLKEVSLQLLKVSDLEALLAGKDPLKDVSAFPFWVKLWEASMVLSLLLESLPAKGDGCTLLELGAGLGAPGLTAAACGYKATLSDYEEHILDFERLSAAASGLHDVDFQLIDWLNPPELEPYDVIVGAEILFRDEFFQPLLNVFNKLLAPGGVIYLAHDVRRKSLPKFLLLAEKEYDIAVSKRTLKADDKATTVIINRLTPKK
jgi:predicted nicotinamide N-methyase